MNGKGHLHGGPSRRDRYERLRSRARSSARAVRAKMLADAFRRWFLIAMIFLGLYLARAAIYKLHLA
jgi:hypothetical protein